jgi:glycosyltransferase involved in cell wall biosynthesis
LHNLLLTNESYHVTRFENAAFAQHLTEVLSTGDFDVVQLETLYLSSYIPLIRRCAPRARVVMRSHNVEHEIWERVAQNSGPLKRWYLQTITPRLRHYEVMHLNDYDLLVSISARDLEHFQRLGLQRPATVAPIGLDCRDYQPDYVAYQQPLSLSFIGSLDWMPNLEGLDWFLDQVWPLLLREFPNLTFHIAGRNTPARLLRLQTTGVTVHGEVPSSADFLNQHAITVAPLLSGGGMRAKILEGMALGRTVLSTTVGMEGIEARHGHEALLADTPEQMLEAVRNCHQAGPDLQQLGQRARLFCETKYDNLGTARHLLETYQQMVGSQSTVPS